MSRTFSIFRPWRLLSLLTNALAAVCFVGLPGVSARAAAYTYGTTPQRTVNAGILLADGNTTPNGANTWTGTSAFLANKDPYVFYVLSQRTDIVPFGWSIVNPLAPGAVTSQIKLRWDIRTGADATTPLYQTYQLGQTVTPAMAAYWEVSLAQTTREDLAKFDVLLLNVENGCALAPEGVEKLRRFVEGGGTLWIEDSHSPVNGVGGTFAVGPTNPPLFGALQFSGNTSGTSPANFAAVSGFARSSLITTPYSLSENELNSLGENHVGNYASSGASAGTAPTVFSPLSVVVNNGPLGTTQPLIAAGQYGAGQVVITCTGTANAVNDYVGGVDVYQTAGASHQNSGPYCGTAYQLAPTQDLKFTTDILASADAHSSEHQNSHQSGASLSGLPAVAKSWADADHPGGAAVTSGATTYGHMGYVTQGGVLYAYDLYPSEDLDGDGDPDDPKGTTTAQDYDTGKPYDVVWTANVKPNASAPTVALATVGGQTGPAVFVETATGTLLAYNATDGAVITVPAVTASSASYPTATGVTTPAPTFFDGKVYLGNADGSLVVVPLSGTSATILVNPNTTDTSLAIVAAPTVGIIPSTRGDNDIVALCSTPNGLYSVFLGSRGERLQRAGGGYNTKLASLTKGRLDTTNPLVYSTLTVAPYTPTQPVPAVTANATAPNFAGYTGTDPLFANYDADIALSSNSNANAGALTRTLVGGAPNSGATGATVTNAALNAIVSTPALDRFGNVYYTVTDPSTGNSTLFSVHDTPNAGDVRINWRFHLPTSAADPGPDADGTYYSALTGYQFLAGGLASAPVVDAQGNVYVLATGRAYGVVGGRTSTSTAVLCFNGLGAITADIGDPTVRQSGVTITQPLASGTDEFGGGTPTALSPNQFNVDASGRVTFSNFASETNVGSGTHALYPNLNEPYPVTIAYNSGGGQNQQAQSGVIRPLHTNLTWYTLLDGTQVTYPNAINPTKPATVNRPVALATSGLTKAGNALYFVGDFTPQPLPGQNGITTRQALISVTATPETITKKFVESSVSPYITAAAVSTPVAASYGPTGTGTTTAVPSASNGVLLVNGALGTTAFTNQITLVVDNNRVLEMDSNGDAQWAVDATSKTTLAGDTTPIYNYNPTTNALGTGQFVTTTLELNRPSTVTELTQNDYLVADTGNNRCVRFDRGGKVLWELTKFRDATVPGFKPIPLLKPGEPDTLNQPTSVQITTTYDAVTSTTVVHYLISDTGNYRIVEIDDVYDKSLTLVGNHILKWISHTHDLQGRDYRYQSASYYASPSGKFYVVALITNKRLAPFTTAAPAAAQYGAAAPSLLGPSNQDAPGGTIVLLDYDPANSFGGAGFGTNSQADGFIGTTAVAGGISPIAISTIVASIVPLANPRGANDGKFDPTGASPQQTLYIRNPRYLKVVTKKQTPTGGGTPISVRHYLLADDNGAWDLDGDTFVAGFGFTGADYQAMTAPFSLAATPAIPTRPRDGVSFLPGSIQLLGTDTVTGVASPLGRYLITNTFSQGEAANDVNRLSGEVFEIDQINPTAAQTGGYNNHTLSRPTNTSPLSQPAFAYRLQ